MLKKLLLTTLILTFSLQAKSIKVAVAANVTYAIEALKVEFLKSHPDTTIDVIIGSSGKLTAQILHGAPYDIFMSADMRYPQKLFKKSLALSKPRIYAQGALVYLSKKSRDFSKGFELLKSKDIKHIAVANPKTAPYGIATDSALKSAGILKEIEKKFIYGESIGQTLSYTLKAAEVGFIAKSALYSPKLAKFKNREHYRDVDSRLYTPIDQGIVLLKRAKDNHEAKVFYNFIFSTQAKKILHAFGYTTL
jgi:molybdate transport system substrate-binding protein